MFPDEHPNDPLTAYLAERDAGCPRCGYNLRGLRQDRCPECNTRIELTIRVGELAPGRYLGTLAGLLAGAGGAGAGLLLITLLSWWYHDWPPAVVVVTPAFVLAVLGPTALWLATHRGRL
jgi:hypothetical protein